MASTVRTHRRRPRTAYLVQLGRPFRHSEDNDLIDGVYTDPEGDPVGVIVPKDDLRREPVDTFLLLIADGVMPVHAEAALDSDHRVTSYEAMVALVYEPDEQPPAAVRRDGEAWDAGDRVAYTFEAEEDAMAAQEA